VYKFYCERVFMEPQEEQVLIHIRGTLYFVHDLTLSVQQVLRLGYRGLQQQKYIIFDKNRGDKVLYARKLPLRRKKYLSAVVPQSPVVRTYYLVVLNHQLGLGLAYIQIISIRVFTTITYKVKFNFWKL
jgi:hypothetical protein